VNEGHNSLYYVLSDAAARVKVDCWFNVPWANRVAHIRNMFVVIREMEREQGL
jgi:hypothetical protein